MRYSIECLEVEGEAPRKYAEPSFSKIRSAERKGRSSARVIGGDQGDIHFDGYSLEDGKTILTDPILVTTHDDLSEDDVINIANEILACAMDSIGFEALY